MKHAWVIGAVALLAMFSAHAQDWPRVAMPKQVRAFEIAQEIDVNAMPMRLRGFMSGEPVDRTVELFRESMGAPIVESRLGTQRNLGRMEGEFYVSVQIEPAGRGSRGTTAVSHLKAALDGHDAALRQQAAWTSRLLPGTRILSETRSRDGANFSRHFVFTNTWGEAPNRERIKKLLQEDGLALQWEGRPGDALFFKGRANGRQEAIATIHEGDDGHTTVVLNVVTQHGASQ